MVLLLVGLVLCGGSVGSMSGVGLLNSGRQELSLSLLEEQLLLSGEESGKLEVQEVQEEEETATETKKETFRDDKRRVEKWR